MTGANDQGPQVQSFGNCGTEHSADLRLGQLALNRADKDQATAVARALLAGIMATPSRADDGRRTVILTAGPWTREIEPHQLQDALKAYRSERASRADLEHASVEVAG